MNTTHSRSAMSAVSAVSRSTYIAVTAFLALTTGVGCGATTQTAAPSTPAKVETVVLADGVELKVSEDAGPEARRVVDQIRSEMRSRYIGAR